MTNKSQPKTIRWGIIGLGTIAHKFATDLVSITDAELYAVASRSQEKADAFAQKYGATIAYNNYEALANDPNIDVFRKWESRFRRKTICHECRRCKYYDC